MREIQGIRHSWPTRTQRLVSHLPAISWLFPRLVGKYSVDWWDKSLTLGRCVSCYIWHKTNTAFHKKNIIPTVKHGDTVGSVLSCLKILHCGWIKTILQRRVGQNSSAAMWRTHCELSQTLDCSCCCKGRLLDLGAITFSHRARQVWTAYFP